MNAEDVRKVELDEEKRTSADELIALHERLNGSRAVLAARLRTNLRTLENWEQGRAKPNAQAALLIRLAARYPETMERLVTL